MSLFNVVVAAVSAVIAAFAVVVFVRNRREGRREVDVEELMPYEDTPRLDLLPRTGSYRPRWKTEIDLKPFALEAHVPPPVPRPVPPAPPPPDLTEYAVEVMPMFDVTPPPEEIFRPRGKTPETVVTNDEPAFHPVVVDFDPDKTPVPVLGPLVSDEMSNDETAVRDLSPIASLMKRKS